MFLNTDKEVLTFDETCHYTGISKSYLYKLTSGRRIPFYKPTGQLVYFKRSELIDWLLSNRISTQEEIGMQATMWNLKNKFN